MTTITFNDSTIEVDAQIIAAGLQLEPDALREGFRNGTITSQCEKGLSEDVGRWRLTFWSPTHRLRLTVDDRGAVLQTSTAKVTRRKGGTSTES